MPVIVNWTVFSAPTRAGNYIFARNDPSLQMVIQEPKNLYAYLQQHRKSSTYLKCYATIDTLKNAFIVEAPFDLEIKFDRQNKWLSVNGVTQDFYDKFINNRIGEYGENDPAMVSFPPNYLFYSDVPVRMSMLPIPLLGEVKNTRIVPGRFDISKWIRPIDWTFEIEDDTKSITIRRGDPLFALLFDTEDNERVELNRVPFTEELFNISFACTGVKTKIKNLPLKKCYEMAESFLAMWRKYRSK